MNITVYCGSNVGLDPAYAEAARELGAWIGESGHTLVYGAGAKGMMGVLCDSVLKHNGSVIGIIPDFLATPEQLHPGLTETQVVTTMSERKARMIALGDAFLALPGGESPILDSEVPVRQILEQIIAKTGLPPFLLGLSWSTTERMSAQQADLLTSELWAIRRSVEPVIRKICKLWLVLEGYDPKMEIVWDEISLQDMAETARAELYRAQAQKLTVDSGQLTVGR